jgi:hypothetical protein
MNYRISTLNNHLKHASVGFHMVIENAIARQEQPLFANQQHKAGFWNVFVHLL